MSASRLNNIYDSRLNNTIFAESPLEFSRNFHNAKYAKRFTQLVNKTKRVSFADLTPEEAGELYVLAEFIQGGIERLMTSVSEDDFESGSPEHLIFRDAKRLLLVLDSHLDSLSMLKDKDSNKAYNQVLNQDYSDFVAL